MEFDKAIGYNSPTAPFPAKPYDPFDRKELSAQNMSVLHFYVDNLSRVPEDPFQSMEKHLEIIRNLVANGANPTAKATFNLTKYYTTRSLSLSEQIQSSIELTASEYLRNIADQIINRFSYNNDAFLIKTYKEEKDFLKNINYQSKEEQTRQHKKFHQFRNFERVLSGEQALPYAGLPDLGKMQQWTLKKQKSVVEPKPALQKENCDPKRFEAELSKSRNDQHQGDWLALKKTMVDYVKEGESLQDFLTRVEQLKKPLQLHFNITTNSKGEVDSYGSVLYRFFHYFSPHKFPNSWENLRKFGQDTYGVDINTPYDQHNTYQ
jgi:hypothetical protein